MDASPKVDPGRKALTTFLDTNGSTAFITAQELESLENRINVEIDSALSNADSPIKRHTLVAGALLKLAKVQLPHEQWKNLRQRNRRVRVYGGVLMRLHTNVAALPEATAHRVGLLEWYAAIRAIDIALKAKAIDRAIGTAQKVTRDLMTGTAPRWQIETARGKLQLALEKLESLLVVEGKK